jgi:uncharacterized membrane protein YidH (DUF202 family)
MRYLSLALIAVGALMFPFAAKRATLGITGEEGNHDVRTALILILIGGAFVAAGVLLAKRDETSSVWRNRNRSRRIRLR